MAPAASAATQCVGFNAAGCAAGSPYVSIQAAAAAAATNDTVRIAPGLYPEFVSTDKRLHFEGFGLDPGSLAQVTGPNNSAATIELNRGGSIRKLSITGGPGILSGAQAVSFRANIAGAHSLELADLRVTGGEQTTTSPSMGSAGNALTVNAAAGTVADVTVARSRLVSGGVNNSTNFGGKAVEFFSDGRLNMADTTASGVTSGNDAVGLDLDKGVVTLDRVTAEGRIGAALAKGSALVRQSTLRGTDTAGLGVFPSVAGGAAVTVRNSVVTNAGSSSATDSGGAWVQSFLAGTPASLTAIGSTFHTTGSSEAGILARRTAANGPTTVSLRNSIARHASPAGGRADVVSDRSAISATSSSFSSRIVQNGGTAPVPGTGGNVAGNPLLTSSLGLLASSPLIDRGDPAAVLAGERDRNGAARSLDGNRDCVARPDIGAFELTGLASACTAANASPVVSRFSVSRKRFKPQTRTKKRRRGTRFRYTLSEAAKVRITIQRVLPGRRVNGRCRRPTRQNRSRRRCRRLQRRGALVASEKTGSQSTAFSGRLRGRALRAGVYFATIVATDAQGAKSKSKRLSFRVRRP